MYNQKTISQTINTDEIRSAIVEADGYVYLSEDETLKEIRKKSIERAKQEALEKAQVYIKSITKVENFVLEYDLISSETEGYIKVLESKDYGIEPDNRYHYWIKAEVQYSLKKPEQEISIDITKNKNAPLTVSVWTEKSEYQEGELMRIFLKGNKDFYARIVYQNTAGDILQLLPNQHRGVNFFMGNHVIMIPDESDVFGIQIEPPYGEEIIIVYASVAALGDAPVSPYGDNLYRVEDNLKDFSTKTRGVRIVVKENDKAAEFFEVQCKVKTKSKSD